MMPPPGMMPPGAYPYGPPPRKKKNTGLVVGLSVGGVVLVGAIIAIIMIATKGGGAPTPPVEPQPREVTGQSGPTEAEKEQAEIKAQQERLDNNYRNWLSTGINTRRLVPLYDKYIALRGEEFRPEVADEATSLKAQFLNHISRAGNAADNNLAAHMRVIDGLHALDDPAAKDTARELAKYVSGHDPANTTLMSWRFVPVEGGLELSSVSKDLKRAANIAGYLAYESPSAWEAQEWLDSIAFFEYREYLNLRRDMESRFPRGIFPPDDAKQLLASEANITALVNKVLADHEKDNFALHAARAFTRFRRNYHARYFDGPRWTYSYAEPFVYFQELMADESQAPESIRKNLEMKANVLRQEVKFFEEKIRRPFNLERLYPESLPPAERNRAPLEIIVLRDQDSFYAMSKQRPEDMQLPPGVRAYYSPLTRQIVTYDEDGAEDDEEKDWWNKSVLIHEAWHFLSAIYMPDRMALRFNLPGDNRDRYYPAYASILIQEGLTDWVAGFDEEAAEPENKFHFGRTNYLRLSSFKQVTDVATRLWKARTEFLKNGPGIPEGMIPWEEGKRMSVIDLRGLVQVSAYWTTQHCSRLALENYGMAFHPLLQAWGENSGLVNYAIGTQAVHYLINYNNGMYADRFWQWVKECYRGDISKSFDWTAFMQSPRRVTPGFTRFMEIFGINGWDDPKWHSMNQEFLDHAMKIPGKDVGSGAEEPIDFDPEDVETRESDWTWSPSQHAGPVGWQGVASRAAIRSKEDELDSEE
jgi:flagellar basal body-associated protein FliL